MSDGTRHRFYGELAPWWPLISPPEEYAEEAAYAATLLQSAADPGPRRVGARQRRRPQRRAPEGALHDDARRPLRRHARRCPGS